MNTILSDPIKPSLSADVILHRNAGPIYAFLSLIHAQPGPKKVLDCGAGGPIPPLSLFAQHGFDAHGIDIDPAQLAKARQFCLERGIPVHFQPADMRQIPYQNATLPDVSLRVDPYVWLDHLLWGRRNLTGGRY